MLTKADGSFELDVDHTAVVSNASVRNDLHVRVLAPEEPSIAPDAQVLYSSAAPRQNAGRTEQYLIRLTTAQLQAAGISVPSEVSADFEPVPNVIGRLNAIASRDTTIADGHIKAARQLVDSHRARFASFHQNFKTSLVDSISRLPTAPLDPDRFVQAGDSVTDKSMATIKKGIKETVNSTDPAKRAPAKGFISLTDAEVSGLRVQVAADGTVPAAALTAIAARNGASASTTYVQANDRLPLCQPPTASFDCANAALNPSTTPMPSTPPPTVPGPGTTGITVDDILRYLARLIDSIQSPEQGLGTGLMPVATRDSVQESIKSFVFNPSPADAPAFHDFYNLQIAFDYVWQEAIDQGILDLAQNAYETIVGLGGNPEHPDYLTGPPVRGLAAEGNLVLKANATPTVVVPDHRGEAPGTRIAPPPPAAGGASSSDGCAFADGDAIVRDHRTQTNPAAIADPTQRLPALLGSAQ